MNRKGKLVKALGPIFGILGIIVVLIGLIFTVMADDGKKPDAKKGFFMFVALALVLFYIVLDTWAITNGKYYKMVAQEDYIYGSAKLFADFVLFFTLLTSLIAGDGGN